LLNFSWEKTRLAILDGKLKWKNARGDVTVLGILRIARSIDQAIEVTHRIPARSSLIHFVLFSYVFSHTSWHCTWNLFFYGYARSYFRNLAFVPLHISVFISRYLCYLCFIPVFGLVSPKCCSIDRFRPYICGSIRLGCESRVAGGVNKCIN